MSSGIIKKAGRALVLLGLPLAVRMKMVDIVKTGIFFLKNIGGITPRVGSEYSVSENFVKYAYRYVDEIESKKKILCDGMDNDSIGLIELSIERYFYIFKHNMINSKQFTAAELQAQKLALPLEKDYARRYPDISYEESCFQYHSGLVFLPKEVIDWIKGRDCLDVGAFIGDSAVVFHNKYAFKNIYSFEPENSNFYALKKNVEKYGLLNVTPVNLGVGKSIGRGQINNKKNTSSFLENKEGDIRITTVDEFVQQRKLDVGVLKMDIEGLEWDAILGSTETIRNQRPVLLIAIYHTGKDFFEIKPYIKSLFGDYNFMLRKINSHNLISEIFLIAWP